MNKLFFTLSFALTLAGCVPLGASNLRFYFTPTTAWKSPAKAPGCRFEFLTVPPQQRFAELGILSSYAIWEGAKERAQIQDIITDVGPHVCAQGGDAIVYPQGTIIKYQDALAAAGSAELPPHR